jgi:hypothetical protein
MEDRGVGDGEVVTACQQACPTEPSCSATSTIPERRQPAQSARRNYALLGELNTRPRTTYLARIAAATAQTPE